MTSPSTSSHIFAQSPVRQSKIKSHFSEVIAREKSGGMNKDDGEENAEENEGDMTSGNGISIQEMFGEQKKTEEEIKYFENPIVNNDESDEEETRSLSEKPQRKTIVMKAKSLVASLFRRPEDGDEGTSVASRRTISLKKQ